MTYFTNFGIFYVILMCCAICECALFFPTNSAYGIFAAIAVPLDLPHRNVFISYNFEANYNDPATWNLPPVLAGFDDERNFSPRQIASSDSLNCTTARTELSEAELEHTTSTCTSTMEEFAAEEQKSHNMTATTIATTRQPKRVRKSLLSRTDFYHILRDKFERSGYSGEACLLRLICEANASVLGDVNGLLGSIMRVIFSPTTSQNEELPLDYYSAEMAGINGRCPIYERNCDESILDLISVPISEIFHAMTTGTVM